MDETFETRLNRLQTDMVSVGMDYCGNKCAQLFIHVINENNTVFSDFFFRIDGEMRKKSKISDDAGIVNPKRQQAALAEIISGARKIFKLCDEYSRPQPTEVKLVYDNMQGGEFQAEYNYDKVTTEDKSDRYISQKWFEKLQG